MEMETEIIDKLFLELSQFTKAKTKRELEVGEGIEKILKWRNFDGDGISDPLRQELKDMVEKKRDGQDPKE